MENYLNIQKSVFISSPAGSGKTEKLARRYISLLKGGTEIQKILAITFTEKAAAEMKERILKILEKEDPDMFRTVLENMPLMRISTIHSFCLKLLKRFSIELGLDPSLDVIDEFNASILWSESVYETLIEEKDSPDLFFDMMVERGIRGWDNLFRILDELHKKRPQPELILKENHPVDGKEGKKILDLYSKCLKRYTKKKIEKRFVDFNDLELLTYEALATNPEWQNILYSFDEHTDHILVDEFQDTSYLQWKILDKLTEEWRSGLGSKRDSGKMPTIFLVGDEKQSIYLFRGANVSIFHEAKEKLSEWLGAEYHFEEARDNYRSLPEIIEFTNSLFSRIMFHNTLENWRTKYAPFKAVRNGNGHVEMILIDGGESTKENRQLEADIISKRMLSLYDKHKIWDGDIKRNCNFGDMAILLRKRTHLPIFEDTLRNYGIPFVVVKGIGFYEEPEVALLREMVSFLVDPQDDYSLFCILRSPLFGISYRMLSRLIFYRDGSLVDTLRRSKDKKLLKATSLLTKWAETARYKSLAMLLENVLAETQGWQYYWEKQRHVNIKKFINLIEQYEQQGFSRLEIREKLINARSSEEAKANVNTEGMNAIKIMTIHAAKGLQFPMVFIPCLDEDNIPRSQPFVIEEEGELISFAYEENSRERKKIKHFLKRKEKEQEEEKRLFYVAVTRAKDFLCLTGAPKKGKPHRGRLAYITNNIKYLPSLKILSKSDVDKIFSDFAPSSLPLYREHEYFLDEPSYTEPIAYEPKLKWRDVTEDLDIRVKHGEDWVLLGRVFHTLFEELSKGQIDFSDIARKSSVLLRNEVYYKEQREQLFKIILEDFKKLDQSGLLKKIILPRRESFSELPFVLQKGHTVFKGRIDRIIIENGTAIIYDYKTFPVKEKEMKGLIDNYRFQMDIYSTAVKKIFSLKTKSFILFTHLPLLVKVDIPPDLSCTYLDRVS